MILQGNCLDVLRRLPDNSVHMCVTSPPYWSLRDYGVPPTIWGGRASCEHEWVCAASTATRATHAMTNAPKTNGRGEAQTSSRKGGETAIDQGKRCAHCGAWLGCLGLQPTPELYVEHIVEVFDQVRRVLRQDGTLWLNLGDCYAAGGRGGNTGGRSGLQGSKQHQEASKAAAARIPSRTSYRRDRRPTGDVRHKQAPDLKPKDLVGIPWMVAFALRARGWYLRMDNIWAKTNPMPESIKDRPTKSHEYVFLLSKSERYFYDAEAVRERDGGRSAGNKARKHRVDHGGNPALKNAHQGFSVPWKSGAGRNLRSVWTLSTAPFKGAHFATFPPRLVAPCILAGTSAHGCCSVCGAPFARIVKLGDELRDQKVRGGCNADGTYHGKAQKAYAGTGAQDPSAVKSRILAGMRERVTVGWRPTCRHTLREVVPCVVLDPFCGSGTTALVAADLGRAFLGIELHPDYVEMSNRRVGIEGNRVVA